MYNLFLVCPECNIEQTIRKKFGDSGLFLTALGGVFHINEPEFINEFNSFLEREQISCIYIVNDTGCTLLENAILNNNQSLPAVKELIELMLQNRGRVINTTLRLAKTNILKQASNLLSIKNVRTKISEGELIIKGIVYFRKTNTFDVYHIRNLNENPRLSTFSDN